MNPHPRCSRTSRLVVGDGRALQEAVADLSGDVAHRAGAMRDEHRRGLGRRADLLHGVEVLGDEHHVHHVLGGGARHVHGEAQHTVPQPIHDCLPLTGDAQPGQVLGLRLTLRALDLHDLLRLGLLVRSHPQPRRCQIEGASQKASVTDGG